MKDILSGSFNLNFDDLMAYVKNNLLILGICVGALCAVGGSLWGYHFYKTSQEEAAHTVLFDCLAQYEQALQNKAQWSDVAAMCQAGYEKYSSTAVAPYLLAVEVDALLAQDQNQAALEKLDAMIGGIDTQSPLYSLFRTKQALLRLDSSDEQLKEKGLHELEQLASDSKNWYNDEAQFYLGLYYREQGQQEKAVAAWKQLIALNDGIADEQARSPWASLAKDKINGLS